MLEKLSIRERNLLAVLLVAILLGIVYFGLIKHLYPQYHQVTEELSIKRQRLIEISERVNLLSNLQSKNKELKNKLQTLTESFNKEVRNGVNYYWVGKHAVDNNVIISEIIPQSVIDKGQYLEIPLKITVRGQYPNVLKFIEQVEKEMPNTSEVRALDLHPVGWEALAAADNKETAEKSEDNLAGQVSQVNSLLKKAANPEKQQQNQSPQMSPLEKLISDKNPDVTAKIDMVTYAVKSPEVIEIAKEKPLGRWDAFSPTVDVPVVEPTPPQEGETGEFPYDEGDLGSLGEVSGGNSGTPDEGDNAGEETEKPPVPEVITTETGDYSFPVRENNPVEEEGSDEK
ncbi:type 4a pilus biogenesis protein PilO [Candidatus Formimonas warabiya]|uniref:Type 4a pilus biogenesis protein PilO n=1 Tax=Formimonas warabiya TaxID=1761012 RepID=A0A3G1KNK5_FORW1|nr:type 4a pilus biogenesis protein PilO [Candidatus Formimonas warabiya]ATW24000.1 hypothetical protein DCMF_03620 [Candidatus Formimonas warabiya]